MQQGLALTYRSTTVFRSEPAYQNLHRRRRVPGEAMALCAKNEKADLTARDKKALATDLKEITASWRRK
jgi:hypothetical protein